MYCRYCGQDLPDDSKFCNRCGKPVDTDSSAPTEKGMGTLAIRRLPSVKDASIPADIYIDEALIGSVNNNMDCRFRLPIGKHSVKIMVRNRYIGTRYIDIPLNEVISIFFAADDVLRISHELQYTSTPIKTTRKAFRPKLRKIAVILFAGALLLLLIYLLLFHSHVSAKTAVAVLREQIRYYYDYAIDMFLG